MTSDNQLSQLTSSITAVSSFPRLSGSHLTKFLAELQIGLLVENSQRRVLYANPVLCQLMRITVSPEDLIGDNYSNVVERSRPFLVDVSAFLYRTEGLRHAQQQAQRELLPFSDGRILEFEYHPVSITEEYQGHLWIFRDVTERERTQHAFLHHQRSVDSLLEILPDIIYILDLFHKSVLISRL